MMGCKKCHSVCGWLLLLFGVGFLLQDLGRWTFWGLNWWTLLFLLLGVGSIGMTCCKDCCKQRWECCGMCGSDSKSAKKKK